MDCSVSLFRFFFTFLSFHWVYVNIYVCSLSLPPFDLRIYVYHIRQPVSIYSNRLDIHQISFSFCKVLLSFLDFSPLRVSRVGLAKSSIYCFPRTRGDNLLAPARSARRKFGLCTLTRHILLATCKLRERLEYSWAIFFIQLSFLAILLVVCSTSSGAGGCEKRVLFLGSEGLRWAGSNP